MSCNFYTRQISRISLVIILLFSSSCIYFNTFYNAKESFKEAQEIINTRDYSDTELPPQAKTLLDEAIINSKIVIQNYPDSKYVEEAYYIIAVSKFLKDDYLSAMDNLNILISKFPKGKYANQSTLWLALSELKTENYSDAKKIINEIKSNKKINKYEKYLLNQIIAELHLVDKNIDKTYEYLKYALKYSSTDREKINIFNKLILIAESNNDYQNIIIFLDDFYEILEDEKDKKEIKLMSLNYNKKINNYNFLITEIETLLDLSMFVDKRLFLSLELAKAYYEIDDLTTSKDLFQSIVDEYSRKQETAEAYYYLAKIQMYEKFDFELIRTFLEKSKSEKSSSKYGKISKELLRKIDSLQDFIYEYDHSSKQDLENNLDGLESDSLLFSMAQSFYFDLDQKDSAVTRHSELLNKFENSKYAPKSVFILSIIDSTNSKWKTLLDSVYADFTKSIYSQDNSINQIFSPSFYYAIDLLEQGNYKQSYDLFISNLNKTNESKFYIAYINEVYLLDAISMIKYYIEYVNQSEMSNNLESAKEKLSIYYYSINQKIKLFKMKKLLSECNDKIVNISSSDSIKKCFENIDNTMNLFSDDSLENRFSENQLLKIPYRSFKNKVKEIDAPFTDIDKNYKLIKNTIVADSLFSFSNAPDSIQAIINSYLIDQNNLEIINKEIEKLDSYISMYSQLILRDEAPIIDSTSINDRKSDFFKNLEFEDVEFDKIKLNLNK